MRAARLVARAGRAEARALARDAERIVAGVDWSADACPRTYVYALPTTMSDWAPGDAAPDDGVDANANLLEVLVDVLQKRCAAKSPADAASS